MTESRVCNVCKIAKCLDDYHNCKKFPLGKVYTCKVCAKAKSVTWSLHNKERKKFINRLHYENNKQPYLERGRKSNWAALNRERSRELAKKRYWADRAKSIEALAERRANRHMATPPWLTNEQRRQITDVYKLARNLSSETGVEHQVDHIVPLKSTLVCGLHVPWNLRPLPKIENISKGNKLLEELL